MANAVFGSPIKMVHGETVSLTTTAAHLAVQPMSETDGAMEYMFYCSSAWRMALCPKLARARVLVGTTYTDYTVEATDRLDTTDVVVDAMATSSILYLGTTGKTRGFYINMDATGVNANAATLDAEYCYDIAGQFAVNNAPYQTITGTVSAAFTVGETITGGTSTATGTVVFDDASTYVVVKDVAGKFVVGETATGASQNISAVTAIALTTKGTPYFTDAAGDSDGTYTGTETLSQDGLYAITLPSVVKGPVPTLGGENLYWYRFKPSATLTATTRINGIIPAAADTNYAYMQGGLAYQFSINTAEVGAFEFDHGSTGTLNVSRIMH